VRSFTGDREGFVSAKVALEWMKQQMGRATQEELTSEANAIKLLRTSPLDVLLWNSSTTMPQVPKVFADKWNEMITGPMAPRKRKPSATSASTINKTSHQKPMKTVEQTHLEHIRKLQRQASRS